MGADSLIAAMDEAAIREYVAATCPGTDVVIASQEGDAPEVAWGDTFFIYDPERNLEGAQRFPFATIVVKDYPGWDEASNLNREGVFRLNIGVDRETFDGLFEPGAEHDFTALDTLMPHPVYAEQHWVSVLNPSPATFERIKPLLGSAYQVAVRRRQRRQARRS